MLHLLRRSALIVLIIILAGCSSANANPAVPATTNAGPADPPPAPSTTPLPSATPTERATPSPTLPASSATPAHSPTATPLPITRLLFTGVIVPARCVQAALDEIGDLDYPYEEVRDLIHNADLAVGTFNATMSDAAPRTGCVPTYVLVGDPQNADAMARAGFDVMSVATNHIKNCGVTTCGDRAFFDTLANLERVGIIAVGAGANHAQAMRPVVVTLNGVRFGIVSLGQIEPMAFAGEDSPGIAVLTPENLREAIEAARAVSDVVIAMPHWGPEDVPVPNYIQRGLAKQAVEYGADLVVGNHTHVVQAIQDIEGVPVFYGLGNFVFDQGLRDHKQGVMLIVTFEGSEYSGYELVPTHVDRDGRVHIADEGEAQEIIERIESASAGLR